MTIRSLQWTYHKGERSKMADTLCQNCRSENKCFLKEKPTGNYCPYKQVQLTGTTKAGIPFSLLQDRMLPLFL